MAPNADPPEHPCEAPACDPITQRVQLGLPNSSGCSFHHCNPVSHILKTALFGERRKRFGDEVEEERERMVAGEREAEGLVTFSGACVSESRPWLLRLVLTRFLRLRSTM